MAYTRVIKKYDEYAGESFSQAVTKNSKAAWENNETATYTMVDTAGATVVTGALVKSTDKRSMAFVIPYGDTTGLDGKYRILVDLFDSNNADVKDVIAEYNISYTARQAT